MGRAYKTSYAGPERFAAFGGTFCKIEQSAAPELYAMAQAFPKEFSRALRYAGYLLRGELKAALRGTGGVRASWPELSKMHRYRRMDLLKAGTWSGSRNLTMAEEVSPVRLYCTPNSMSFCLTASSSESVALAIFVGKSDVIASRICSRIAEALPSNKVSGTTSLMMFL